MVTSSTPHRSIIATAIPIAEKPLYSRHNITIVLSTSHSVRIGGLAFVLGGRLGSIDLFQESGLQSGSGLEG